MSRFESDRSRNTDPVNAVILGALAEVRRRLRLNFALRDGLLLAALLILGLLAWRLLHVFGDNAPAASLLTILIALLLAIGVVFRLGANRLRARVTLAQAAAEADARAGLKDELRTAYWFLSQPKPSPWVSAQATRAARSVQQLESARVVPLRLPAAASAALAGGLVSLALAWTITPLAGLEPARVEDAQLSPGQARQIEMIRALIAQSPGDEAASKLEQTLRTLERKEASAQEKQLALEQAQEAVEQRTLEAASAREGLRRLAARVRSAQGMEEVAAALDQGDANAAARRLEKLVGARLGGDVAGQAALDVEQAAREKDLERLLQEAAGVGGEQLEQRQVAAAAMKEAVDRLKKISEQLEVQGRLSEAAQSLQQLRQLTVAQRSVLSAGRFAQQAAQSSTPGPESGNTAMPGGVMFRSAAVAQETKRSQQQEGSKTGDAMSDSEADPVLGAKSERLEAQLTREAIQKEGKAGENGPEAWFYAQSKQQKSTLDLQGVQARARYAQSDTTAPEGIAMRHRQIVKDYFMNLREAAQ